MSAGPAQSFSRPCCKTALRKIVEALGTAYDGAIRAGPQKVVAHAVPSREAWFAGEVRFGI